MIDFLGAALRRLPVRLLRRRVGPTTRPSATRSRCRRSRTSPRCRRPDPERRPHEHLPARARAPVVGQRGHQPSTGPTSGSTRAGRSARSGSSASSRRLGPGLARAALRRRVRGRLRGRLEHRAGRCSTTTRRRCSSPSSRPTSAGAMTLEGYREIIGDDDRSTTSPRRLQTRVRLRQHLDAGVHRLRARASRGSPAPSWQLLDELLPAVAVRHGEADDPARRLLA